MHRTHELKTEYVYFQATKAGEKLWEVRLNDRFYQMGDTVILRCLSRDGIGYARHEGLLKFTVGPVLQGGQFGIQPGYCIFGLIPVKAD